jgi:putative transposase
MPAGLKRYQQSLQLHYITFNCFQHAPLLATPAARELVEHTLERVRRWYGFYVNAYVVMPDHVHVLMSEPERASLAVAIQMWKQIVSRREHGQRLPIAAVGKQHNKPFWQARYYDFNLWSEKKLYEKMNYIHQNPVRRGLVARAEDWKWSSFRHLATGEEGIVEVESQWTARKREELGMTPHIKRYAEQPVPPFAGRQQE